MFPYFFRKRVIKIVEHTLWKNDNFINRNILFLFNKEITEYDMKEAGFSLIQEFKLLPESMINKLKTYGKDERKIKIGDLQRDNEKLKNDMKEAFAQARKIFMEMNKLEPNDIITVKKDAIITCKICNHTKLGKYIDFRPKHTYTSYIQLDKRLELYYSPYDFAVKGIGDDKLQYHEEYMIHFLKLYFRKMESEDRSTVIGFVRRFIDRYKRRELNVGYYRQFDTKSEYHVIGSNDTFTEFWEEDKDDLDISYNFLKVLIKLIKIPL